MTKADLVAAVHGSHGGVSRAEALRIVDTLFDRVREVLVGQGVLRIADFGTLEVRRRGRGRVPVFRPARSLRESLEAPGSGSGR